MVFKKFIMPRDELSFGNIRLNYWPLLIIFPLSVINGNFRYYTHSIALSGIEIDFLLFFLFGLGWLITAFLNKNKIITILKITISFSVAVNIYLLFLPMGFNNFITYLLIQFLNGICTACAFYIFCFYLNNIEKLLGIIIIQIFYGIYYIVLTTLPVIHLFGNNNINLIFIILLLIIIFFIKTKHININTNKDGKESGFHFVIGLNIIHYIIMCMGNYIEWTENAIYSLFFGIGILVSIILIFILQFLNNRNSMYIWFLYLALTLLGLASLLYNNKFSFIFGSFIYGTGDSLGYIVICYLCAGAIKKTQSFKMFKLYCVIQFFQFFLISGFFSLVFNYFDAPNKAISFGVVLIMVCLCMFFMPLIQKRIFDADWTDGLYLCDMDEYSEPLLKTENINNENNLNLTPREKEIFTMLLNGTSPKEIAHILKISYHTEHYHQKNLYRKLGIQSITEFFAKYGEYKN